MGDVKLAALIGLAAGAATPDAAVAAFLLGGVAASIALVRRGRGVRIPFGPWLLAGYWVALIAERFGYHHVTVQVEYGACLDQAH